MDEGQYSTINECYNKKGRRVQQTEIWWKQYQQNVDLYKFYMDVTLKLQVFYYGITGAIFSYYFSNVSIPNIKYSLLLPAIMSIVFALFYIYAAVLIGVTREETFALRDKLELSVAPDLGVLRVLWFIFGTMSIVVAIACFVIVDGSLYP